jgi:hypothetical protein
MIKPEGNNMEKEDWDRQNSSELVDFSGREIVVGDCLIRADSFWKGFIKRDKVTKIVDGRMFLGDSNVPIQFPGRCVLIKDR